MRSSLLNDTFSNWEKVQCKLNGASVGFTFFQEMPASAIDNAFAQIWEAYFALRFTVCLEQFKQFYIAHIPNHFLGLLTKCLFVLETIRTSAMRVIHIIKKTEETQRLRIVFVLYCSTWIQTQNKIYHSICQQIDKSGIGSTSQPWIKDMRTAVQNVPKVCLAVANPKKFDITSLRAWILHHPPRSLSCCRQPISKTKQEGSPTKHLSVHGFCILDHSLFGGLYCCRQPKSKTKQNPTAHLPKDPSPSTPIFVNAPEPTTTLQHLNNLDACSPYQTPDVTGCVQVHFDAEFYTSSEDDVSSRPAKSLTPSPVAAPESPPLY